MDVAYQTTHKIYKYLFINKILYYAIYPAYKIDRLMDEIVLLIYDTTRVYFLIQYFATYLGLLKKIPRQARYN